VGTVRVDVRGAVRVLVIERPEVHNCVDPATAIAIGEAIDAFAGDAEAHVLVVTGEETAAFCTGADLRAADGLLSHAYAERGSPLGFGRLDPGKPTIAAIEGYCFAGGMELAAWCDVRVAAAGATFGALNRRFGVPFIDGGTQRFPRLVGTGNALYVVETGARFDAERARAMGFVQEVVPDGQALARALELAERIAAYPNQGAIRADRASILDPEALDAGILRESERGRPTTADAGMAAGLRAFDEGRRPQPPEAR